MAVITPDTAAVYSNAFFGEEEEMGGKKNYIYWGGGGAIFHQLDNKAFEMQKREEKNNTFQNFSTPSKTQKHTGRHKQHSRYPGHVFVISSRKVATHITKEHFLDPWLRHPNNRLSALVSLSLWQGVHLLVLFPAPTSSTPF